MVGKKVSPRGKRGEIVSSPAELMAEYRDLDVLLVRARSESNQIEQLANEQESDRTTHSEDRGRCTAVLISGRIARLHPSGLMQKASRSLDLLDCYVSPVIARDLRR